MKRTGAFWRVGNLLMVAMAATLVRTFERQGAQGGGRGRTSGSPYFRPMSTSA